MPREDVLYLNARELARRMHARELSPVELTESYLERSRTVGARLNAYATLTEARALEEAHAAEREIERGQIRSALHGVPYAAKDLLATRGDATEWGARPYAGQTFDFDATVIRKLHDAGAILIGKAAMIELAGGLGYRYGNASSSGAARNPWSTDCWTCGSSSGSAAVVAGGLAGFAIGTETWGSILCPSAYTGSTGFRPTYGRVSRHGGMALAPSLDKIGPMARSAEDCALVLEVIAGHDSADGASLPESDALFRADSSMSSSMSSRLRIGWLTNQWSKLDPEIEVAMDAARAELQNAGCTFQDVALPEGPWEAAAGLVISVEAAAAYQEIIESGRVSLLVDDLGKIGGYINEAIPASDYVRALRIRAVLQRKIDALFDEVDLLMTATLPVPATKIEADLYAALAFSDPIGGIGNFCGLPAASVPAGFTGAGLPACVQFVGRAFDDATVLRAAMLFQSRTDWHLRHPSL